VRGREKVLVGSLLAASATASGAVLGFAAGVTWAVSSLQVLAPPVAIGIVGAAVLADLTARRWPRLGPPSVGRQVPREWSRYFSPPTVAVLYGARLGVGPATMLPSWLWWALLVLAASTGVWVSVAAGAVFGLVRTMLMILLAEWARHAMAPRMASLRAAEPGVLAVLTALAPVTVAVAIALGDG
jgi:hypothetical protein